MWLLRKQKNIKSIFGSLCILYRGAEDWADYMVLIFKFYIVPVRFCCKKLARVLLKLFSGLKHFWRRANASRVRLRDVKNVLNQRTDSIEHVPGFLEQK